MVNSAAELSAAIVSAKREAKAASRLNHANGATVAVDPSTIELLEASGDPDTGDPFHLVITDLKMPKMGGLLKKMPITAITMLIGCLAIAGAGIPYVIGFSGYYSKDAILEQAHDHAEEIRRLLVEQVTGRVRWRETMEWLAGPGGVTRFVRRSEVRFVEEAGLPTLLPGPLRRIDLRTTSCGYFSATTFSISEARRCPSRMARITNSQFFQC